MTMFCLSRLWARASDLFNSKWLRKLTALECFYRFRRFKISSISSKYLVCWNTDGFPDSAFVAFVIFARARMLCEFPDKVLSFSSSPLTWCSSLRISVGIYLLVVSYSSFPFSCLRWIGFPFPKEWYCFWPANWSLRFYYMWFSMSHTSTRPMLSECFQP